MIVDAMMNIQNGVSGGHSSLQYHIIGSENEYFVLYFVESVENFRQYVVRALVGELSRDGVEYASPEISARLLDGISISCRMQRLMTKRPTASWELLRLNRTCSI